MLKFLVKSPFTVKTPLGPKKLNSGEVISLSHTSAKSLVAKGLMVEKNIGLDLLHRYEARVYVLRAYLGYFC